MDLLADKILLRPARIEEIPVLQDIDLAASALFEPTGLIDEGPDGPQPIPEKNLAEGIKSRNLTLAEFTPDNRPVGFALCRQVRPDLYLDQISVHPEFGRRGLGGRLLNAVISHGDALSLRGVVLSTFRDLKWNGPFYAAHGFEEIPRHQMKTWMFDLEALQAESMDVSLRCFMRRPGKAHKNWLRLRKRDQGRDEKRIATHSDS